MLVRVATQILVLPASDTMHTGYWQAASLPVLPSICLWIYM